MLQIEHVPIETLVPASYNPRRMPDHQMAALMRSLEQFGWVDPVVVNQRSGVIVGGHQRVEAAKRLQDQGKGKAKQAWAKVPVTYVDLDEGKEKALNVALNKVTGDFDYPKLSALLETLEIDDLALTGFSAAELDLLLAEVSKGTPDGEVVDDTEAEWQGMPEFESADGVSWRKLIVHFECQEHFDEFCALINQEVSEKTKSIWHPFKERRDLKSLGYE